MWYGEVFCIALFGKICFWKRCNNQRRKRFPCLTRCFGKTSLFKWYTRFPGCPKNPDHKYFPGIWPVLQIFLLTHARLVRRRNAKDEKLSGAIWLSLSSPLSGKLHSIRNLLSSDWQKNFRSPDPGTIALPCMSLTQCYCWDFKVIILVSQYTCQIVYADADVMLILMLVRSLMLMLILMLVLSLLLISMLMKLLMINKF